jgi:hypothetical protein
MLWKRVPKTKIHSPDIPETVDGLGNGAGADVDDRDYPEFIPAEYNNRTTLKADVVSGSNTFDFKLTGEKRPVRGKMKTPPRRSSSGAR